VLSKLVERLVASHLSQWSTCRPPVFFLHYSLGSGRVENAVLRVLSDILLAVDRAVLAALILLDLMAAFDTVDHDILLQRLKVSFGFTDVALHSCYNRTWSDGHST